MTAQQQGLAFGISITGQTVGQTVGQTIDGVVVDFNGGLLLPCFMHKLSTK